MPKSPKPSRKQLHENSVQSQTDRTAHYDALEPQVRALRSANESWSQVAARLDITEGQARWPIDRNKTPEALNREAGELPRTRSRPGEGPGIGVSEAARILKVTRRTVYAWIRNGRLRVDRNEKGHSRVLLDSVTPPLAPADEVTGPAA